MIPIKDNDLGVGSDNTLKADCNHIFSIVSRANEMIDSIVRNFISIEVNVV